MNAGSRSMFLGWMGAGAKQGGAVDARATERVADGMTRRQAPGLSLSVRTPGARLIESPAGYTVVAGRPRNVAGSADASDREIADAVTGDVSSATVLTGRYSIVHVDRERHRVVLVTDRFGSYPLCYAVEGGRLSFSDRADEVPTPGARDIDPQAFFDYAYFHVVPAPRTIFRAIRRLEPSRRLTFSNGAVDLVTTWRPGFHSAGGTRAVPATAEFLALIRSAVSDEAASDQPVGAFLSGGTDSSTVAGMLGTVLGAPAEAFSIGFESTGYDEIEYATIAAKHFKCRHHVYYVTPTDVASSMPKIAAQYDQPFGNSSALPAYYCAQFARSHGMRKLLAGDGGDELFGGNTRYAKQKVFGVYSAAVPAWLRRGLVEPALLHESMRSLPIVRKLASYVAQARVPMPDRSESYNLLQRHGIANLFTQRLIDAVDIDAPIALQRRVYAETEGAALVDRMLAYDWRFTLADNDLPKVVGMTAMAGIAVGFPLLDDRLVDLSLRLTPSQKVRGLALRHWFKRSLSDFLPEEIIRKKKHGFGLPFGPWLVSQPALQRLAREAVGGLIDRGLIEPGAMDRLFSHELEQHPGYFGEMIWILTMGEHWLRRAAPGWRLG